MVLNYCIHASKAVISFYNLYIECLYTSSQYAGKHCVELLLLYVHLPADAKEDLDFIIKKIVRIACVLITTIPELRELRDSISIEPIITTLLWWQCFI